MCVVETHLSKHEVGDTNTGHQAGGRNPYLTAGMDCVLRTMVAVEEHDELTHATPGGWWIGTEKIAGSICYRLLRLCLISRAQDSRDGYERFTINEDGRAALNDTTYVPRLVKMLPEWQREALLRKRV